MPLPRGYISHNQVRSYIDCPRKYCFAYVEEIPPLLNDKILLGQAFHSALEHYFGKRIQNLAVERAEVFAIFNDVFATLKESENVSWSVPPGPTCERGQAFLAYFLTEIGPATRPLFCEKELLVEIGDSGILLKGIIDLVEEDFCITDFKTASNKWSDQKARSSLQMLIYKFLFDRTYGSVNSTLKFEILYARNAENIRHQSLRFTPAADEVERMLDVVVHVAENIGKGVFYKKEGVLCRFCEFRKRCQP